MNKILIKHILTSLVIIAVVIGLYFIGKTINKYRKAVEYTYQKTVAVQEFLKVNFPEQVKSFDETVAKQLEESKKQNEI